MRSPTITAVSIVVLAALGAAILVPAPAGAAAATYTVSGVVVSDKGVPLEGVRVSGWTYQESNVSSDKRATRAPYPGEAITDAEGRWSLQLAAGKGHVNAYYEKWRQSAGREIVVDGNVSDVKITMVTPPPKTAIVVGRVLDMRTGAPIEGATVTLGMGCCYAYATSAEPQPAIAADPATHEPAARPAIMPPCCHDEHQEHRTGADGAFRFETYPGPRSLTVYAKSYGQTTVEFEAVANQTVTKDVRLERIPEETAVIRGRVLDARTGAPVGNADVQINNVEWSRWRHVRTGPDGGFEIKALPGWTTISVNVWRHELAAVEVSDAVAGLSIAPAIAGGQPYYAYARSFAVQSGDNTADVHLEPRPAPSVVLTGYVVDPVAKRGVEGARVSFWNQDTGDWGNAMTDKTGSYKILVRPGHHQVHVWAEGHLPSSATFHVAEGTTAQRFDIESPKGQQKWAPCDDCYADAAVMKGAPPSMAASTTAESYAPGSAAPQPAPAPRAATPLAAPEGAAGPQSYQGSGGGLPPYDPATANQPPQPSTADQVGETPALVPGLGLAVVLVLVAVLAIVARRP